MKRLEILQKFTNKQEANGAMWGSTTSYLLGEEPPDKELKPPAPVQDQLFRRIMAELEDFKDWTKEDKEELLSYLKAKRISRLK